MKPVFLPAIDLEDVRLLMPDGSKHADRVPANTLKYLDFLKNHKIRATFFVVGDVALRHPDLIARIAGEGHEVASHSMRHTPLDQLTADTFTEDVERSLDALQKAGVMRVEGFRAPVFSLTDRAAWAHGRLSRLGFKYSSSVLPARNPLYGWQGFGSECRRMDGGIWEIPMCVGTLPGLKVPFAGGVYFRVLPLFLIQWLTRRHQAMLPVFAPIGGYFHPYDIDTEQERFMHPGIQGKAFFNWLMYRGRSGMLAKFERYLSGVTTMTYSEYVRRNLESV